MRTAVRIIITLRFASVCPRLGADDFDFLALFLSSFDDVNNVDLVAAVSGWIGCYKL